MIRIEGHIRFHRKVLEWEWYSNLNTCRLFVHMLLRANWKDGKFQGYVIKRGSFVSSLPKISDETGLTVNEVRGAIKNLKSTGEITCTKHSKFSVFTINNYSLYQDINTQDNRQLTGNSQADNRQLTGNSHSINTLLTTIEEEEEGKKGRREEEEHISGIKDTSCQTDVRLIVEAWNQCGGLEVKQLSPKSKRYQMLQTRIKEYGVDQVMDAIESIKKSPFLLGQNKNSWIISFEWFVRPNNFPKVMEGNYMARNQGGAGGDNSYNTMLKGWAEGEQGGVCNDSGSIT